MKQNDETFFFLFLSFFSTSRGNRCGMRVSKFALTRRWLEGVCSREAL